MALMFTACVSAPKTTPTQDATWKSRVDISDKVKNKDMALDVTFRAIPFEHLRMDITTPGGYYVGSVLAKSDRFQALIPRERKFYEGPTQSTALRKILLMPLNPHWLNYFLFDQAPQGWRCLKDGRGFPQSCSQNKGDLKVEYRQRQGHRKTIHIQNERFAAEIALNEFRPRIDKKDRAFKLKKPSSYQHVELK